MIKFLNDNAGALSVVFSCVVMIATVVYAFLTGFLVKETRQLRKAETEPSVSIYLDPREEWISLMDLVIQNNGRGPAKNLRFLIEPDFECRAGEFLSAYPFMQQIKHLAPGQRFQFFLASAVDVLQRQEGKSFSITVSYQNSIGDLYRERFDLDFEHFKGMSRIGEPPSYTMAKAIEKLQQDISKALSGFSKLNVAIWTQAELDEERQKRMQRREESSKTEAGKA